MSGGGWCQGVDGVFEDDDRGRTVSGTEYVERTNCTNKERKGRMCALLILRGGNLEEK